MGQQIAHKRLLVAFVVLPLLGAGGLLTGCKSNPEATNMDAAPPSSSSGPAPENMAGKKNTMGAMGKPGGAAPAAARRGNQ